VKIKLRGRVDRAYGWAEANVVTAVFVCSGSAALLAVALTTALGLYSSVTFQAKTACTKDPGGPECAEIRQEVARAEPIKNPCISFQRVTSRRGRNCPGDFTTQGKRSDGVRGSHAASQGAAGPSTAEEEGDTTGGSPGGLSPNGDKGGKPSATPPVEPPGDSTSPPSNPPTSTPGTSSPEASALPPAPPTAKQPVREIVGAAKEGDVGGVLEGAGNAGCALTKSC